MSNQIQRTINGKRIGVLFILTSTVYTLMLTVTIPAVQRYSAGKALPDMMPTGYDIAYLQSLFGTLGEEGRQAYLRQQIPLDMLYPFLFALTYALLLIWVLQKLGKQQQSGWQYIAILPVLAGFFDYMENIGMISMLRNYPFISPAIAGITNTCTILKSGCTTLYFLLLIILLLWLLIKRITMRNK